MAKLTLNEIRLKLDLDKEIFNKCFLYLLTLSVGDEIETRIYKVIKNSENQFSITISKKGIDQLIDNWVLDFSSPLDLLLGIDYDREKV